MPRVSHSANGSAKSSLAGTFRSTPCSSCSAFRSSSLPSISEVRQPSEPFCRSVTRRSCSHTSSRSELSASSDCEASHYYHAAGLSESTAASSTISPWPSWLCPSSSRSGHSTQCPVIQLRRTSIGLSWSLSALASLRSDTTSLVGGTSMSHRYLL